MLRRTLLAAIAALAFAGTAQAQPSQLRYFPSACSISASEFNTWFVSGRMSRNGVVTFADSVGFPTNNTVCDFYKWAHQMFLWITSPLGTGLVLTAPIFFDVNFNAQGNGVFVPNGVGAQTRATPRSFALRGTKPENFQPGGQAGGQDTLLSLNGALVYFGVHANDVYAWFNTAMIKNPASFPPSTPFPTTQAELAKIVAYARQNGASLPDARALTLELKTAWIDAAKVPNPANYVTIQAAVPNYVGSVGAAQWTISTTQPTVTKTLALVGMHVVGPVQGHPEMVWSTFEHRGNAPDNTYYFAAGPNSQAIVTVPYNSSGTWSFMTNGGSQQGALVPQMTVNNSGNIVAKATPPGIQANNVYRVNPWGGPPTPASAGNNAQLLSLNMDIRMMLSVLGDRRQNYFQVGAVWTRNGSVPANGNDTAQQVGSVLLANATMETYHQTDMKGCFGCHASSAANASLGTSHLFSLTNVPLPTK